MQNRKKILVVLTIFVAGPVLALERDDIRVESESGGYHIQMTFEVPASVDQVKSVLTDFAHPARLSSAVIAREIVGERHGVVRVRTRFRDCVLFFCKTMTLIHDVTISANAVRADVVPDGSDFRHGFLLWSIHGIDNGASHIKFEAVMEPDFFVPPLVGGYFVRKALVKQALATAQSLVREAPRERPPGNGEQ